MTLWGNDEAFVQKYLAETPGYYTTGDAGIIDEKGYIHIMTRVDDVINTAGHRISIGRLEESISNIALSSDLTIEIELYPMTGYRRFLESLDVA